MAMNVRRMGHALGAEVTGIDIAKPLDAALREQVHNAFLEHSVLVFRGQRLTREQHIAFSRGFGPLDPNSSPRFQDPAYPEIMLNIHEPSLPGEPEAKYQGDVWHSDRDYTLVPAAASVLRAVAIPDVGGDTMFANMYLAYEALSTGMKNLIAGLHGVRFGARNRADNPSVAHPLVRTHPETGRPALYIGAQVKQLAGMTIDESRPLIEFLCNHAVRPQFVYRHRWCKDDLLMWDNRCTLHMAINDYDKRQRRHMERTTVLGTPSGFVFESARP